MNHSSPGVRAKAVGPSPAQDDRADSVGIESKCAGSTAFWGAASVTKGSRGGDPSGFDSGDVGGRGGGHADRRVGRGQTRPGLGVRGYTVLGFGGQGGQFASGDSSRLRQSPGLHPDGQPIV